MRLIRNKDGSEVTGGQKKEILFWLIAATIFTVIVGYSMYNCMVGSTSNQVGAQEILSNADIATREQ